MSDSVSELSQLSPEALIEGFVREAKLSDPSLETSVSEMNEHGDRSHDYASEIGRRGGLPSLLPLLDSDDNWIAYRTATQLARLPETQERALATLDRLAELRTGSTSFLANSSRNMVRYGNPVGAKWKTER